MVSARTKSPPRSTLCAWLRLRAARGTGDEKKKPGADPGRLAVALR
jgi:hypothetical protein